MAHRGAVALAEIIARRFDSEWCRVKTSKPSCIARFVVCVERSKRGKRFCEPLRINMEYLELLCRLQKNEREKHIAKLLRQMAEFLKRNYPQWPETLNDEPL